MGGTLFTVILPSLGILLINQFPAISLPPPEDIPDEILRNEIIFEARSPIDGQPLTAIQYQELLNKLKGDYTEELLNCPPPPDSQQSSIEPSSDRGFCKLKHLVFQIKILKLFKDLGIPIR